MKKKLLFLFLFTCSLRFSASACPTNITPGPAATICQGGSITLTASGATTYQWLPSGPTTATWTVSPTVNTTYAVIGSSAGCTDTAYVTVTVNALPTVNATAQNDTVCQGITSVLTATGAATYVWQPGAMSGSSVNPTVLNTTIYTVTGTSAGGCSATATYTVVAKPAPKPILIDSVAQALFGAPFNNCSNTTGNPIYALTVQTPLNPTVTSYSLNWGNGQPTLTSLTSGNFPLSNNYNTFGVFNITFTANYTNGCIRDTVIKVVNETNPAIGCTGPGNTQGCAPIPYWFKITGYQNNTPGTYYIWDFGDGDTVIWNSVTLDSISHTYDTTSCGQPGDQFTVKVTAINACASTTATVNGIRIFQKPNAQFSVTPNIACVNTAVSVLNSSTLAANGPPCNNNTGWSWNFGDPASGLANTSNLQHPPAHVYSNSGTYTIRLIAGGACGLDTFHQTVCIEDNIASFQASVPGLCSPAQINLTNNSPLLNNCSSPNFQWTIGKTASSCAADSVNNVLYLGGSSPTSSVPSVQLNNQGTYLITLSKTNSCGTATKDTTLTIKRHPKLSPGATSTVCFPDSVFPISSVTNCGTSPLTYQWSAPGGTPTSSVSPSPGFQFPSGVHTLSLTVGNECGNTAVNQTVTVFPQPAITLGVVPANGICAGASAVLSASGASQYQWTWVGGSSTGTALTVSPAATTTYTLTGTDANGCSATTSYTLVVHPLPQLSATITQPSCQPGNDGSMQLTATGGITPYTFNLNGNNLQAVGLFNNLGTGIYTASVSDANGCTASLIQAISAPNAPTFNSLSGIQPGCNGSSNGSLNATANGGTGTLQYLLQPGSISNATGVFSGLPGGTYSVTVTDAAGCTAVSTINLGQPTLLSFGATTINPVSCFGLNNGQMTTTLSGGTAPYGYTLNPGNISNTIGLFSNLGQGTYTIIGTDANGCSTSTTVSITQPQALSWAAVNGTNIACFNQSTGSLNVQAAGGTAGYFYQTNPGNLSNGTGNFTGLPAQNYTVQAMDANGCSVTTTFSLSQPTAMAFNNIVQSLPTCVPGNDGSLQINGSGGTPNYSYAISPGFSYGPSNTFNSLAPGTYTILVKDANQCTVSTVFPLNSPNAPVWQNVQISTPNCQPGNDGTIQVQAAAGTPPLQYNLLPGFATYQTSGLFSNLSPGTYTATVLDASGCTSSSVVVLNAPPAPSLNALTVQPATCSPGCDGSISVNATGTSPLQYRLNAGAWQASNLFSNLCNGNYTVTVKDAAQCTMSSTIQILIVGTLQFSIDSVKAISCQGLANGLIDLLATGGTGTVVYTLNPGNISNTTGLFSNLSPATYTVIAVDGSGCAQATTLTMSDPPALTWSILSQTAVSCNGGSNGSLTALATGGTGLMTYHLNPGSQSNAAGLFSNLIAGTYTLTATDANGCSQFATAFITQPAALQIVSLSNTLPTCVPGNDASLTVDATGGTSPLSYSAGGSLQSGNTITGLGSGTYTVTVSDVNGCTVNTAWNIVLPNAPVLGNISINPVTCPGGSNGNLSGTATGGTGSLSYSLQPGNQSNLTGSFNGLSAAVYTLTATDALGCAVNAVSPITQPGPWTFPVLQSDSVNCFGGNDGSLTVLAAGGTPGYTYLLQPGGAVNANGLFTGLTAATYTVQVTDASGCTHTGTAPIAEPSVLTFQNAAAQAVNCFGSNTGLITVLASGGTGNLLYLLQPGGLSGSTGNFSNLSAGTYTVTVSDQYNCTVQTSLIVGSPSLLLIDSLQTSVPSCLPSGATAFVSGGTPPYGYSLNGGPLQPNGSWSNLAPGSYTLTVSDAQGCTDAQIFSIIPPASPFINSLVATHPSCFGQSTGSISNLAISGGALPYNVSIFPGGSFVNLAAGTYTILVSDGNSCTGSSLVTLTQPPAITLLSLNLADPSCHSTIDGSVSISATGGSGTLQYDLLPPGIGNTTGIFNSLPPNNYTVSITDDSNCVYTVSAPLLSPPAIQWISVAYTPITCNGLSNASIVGQAIGGTGAYQYSIVPALLPANTSGAFSPLPANNYTLQVQDQNNCQLDTAMVLQQPPPVTGSFFIQNQVSCHNGQNGAFTVLANSGTLPFQFYLMGSAVVNSTGNFSGLPAGNYTVQIVDASNCSAQIGPITITQPPALNWTSISVPLIRCHGTTTDSLSVQATGGSGVLTYSIAPLGPQANSSGQFTGLSAQAYTVTATDMNGCSVTSAVVINELPPILINTAIPILPRCFGESTGSIVVNASGGTPPLSYQLNGAGFVPVPSFQGLGSGTYILSIRDGQNCQIDSVFSIADPPLLQFSNLVVGSVICEDSSDALISVQATGGVGTLRYRLLPDSVTNFSGQFGQLGSGSYTIFVSDTLGCFLDSSVFVSPAQNTLQLTISSQDLGCLGVGTEGWAQADVSGGAQPYSYLWNTNPVQESKRATGLRFGYYHVLVTDYKGCTASDTVYIDPGPCCEEIYIPNAFSPNGDGLNDVFRAVTAAGIQLIRFDIFNRWGQRVWSTEDYTKGWDGKINQTDDAPVASYYYQFTYRCLTDEKTYSRKGDVTIVK